MFKISNSTSVGHSAAEAFYTSGSPFDQLKNIHKTYGHAELPRLSNFIPDHIAPAEISSFECKPCILAKMKKQPFPHRLTHAKKVLQQLHLDLIGPIDPISIVQHRYILNMVDSYSGYSGGFSLQSKSDATDTIIQVLEKEGRRLGYFPERACSDSGGEFANAKLVTFSKGKKITQLMSEPYHPKHNGRAERANHTILEFLRATFDSSNLPKNQWHLILKFCCLSLNQVYRSKIQSSPWTSIHSSTLPTSYLRPLGIPAVVLNQKRSQGRKFQNKGIEGKLIGFNPSLLSYKILIQRNRIINTKNVQFLKLPDSNTANPPENSSEDVPQDSDSITDDFDTRGPESAEDLLQSSPIFEAITSPSISEDAPTNANPDYRKEDQPSRQLRDRASLKPPERLGFHHYYEPRNFEQAVSCAEKSHWRNAVDVELNSIENHEVWEECWVKPPNPLKTTWVLRIKDNCHNAPLKFKARLCVQGFVQIEGLDFDQMFAPTGSLSTLQIIILYALKKDLPIRKFEFQGAFLHPPWEEEVFISTLKGSTCNSPFLKLRKSLYGLKQSPRNWYLTLTDWFKEQGFYEFYGDPYLYKSKEDDSVLFFHVDDMIFVGYSKDFEEKFKSRFLNSTSNGPNTILGSKIERISDRVYLSQPNHIYHALDELRLQD